MAFPAVVTTNESSTNTAGTSHVVNLPGSLVVGNLIVILLDKGSTAATVNAVADWSEVVDENSGNGLYVLCHEVNGSEGSTLTLTTSASTRSAEISYQISGAAAPFVQLPELSTVATGTSVNPNATTCTPTGGAKDYLWLTFFGSAGEEADDDTWVTGTPTSFTNLLQKSCGTAGTNLGGLIGSAQQQLNAASLDAAQFTMAVSAAWRAYTLAIHPEPAAVEPIWAVKGPKLAP